MAKIRSYIDRNDHFHAVAHCYTCYWYPTASWPGTTPSPGSRVGSCAPGSAHCSAHGFSATEAGSWTIGGDEAPYNFTAEDSSGRTRLFSTRERPWGLLGGVHGDEWQVLINARLPRARGPEYVKFLAGRDWTTPTCRAFK